MIIRTEKGLLEGLFRTVFEDASATSHFRQNNSMIQANTPKVSYLSEMSYFQKRLSGFDSHRYSKNRVRIFE